MFVDIHRRSHMSMVGNENGASHLFHTLPSQLSMTRSATETNEENSLSQKVVSLPSELTVTHVSLFEEPGSLTPTSDCESSSERTESEIKTTNDNFVQPFTRKVTLHDLVKTGVEEIECLLNKIVLEMDHTHPDGAWPE